MVEYDALKDYTREFLDRSYKILYNSPMNATLRGWLETPDSVFDSSDDDSVRSQYL